MKQYFSIFLLYVLLFQFSVKTTLVVNYFNNIDEISSNCTNKTKPELQCFGKCILAKWVKEVEKHENQENSLKPYFENHVLFCNNFYSEIYFSYSVVNYPTEQQNQVQNGFATVLEQPPSKLS